MKLLIRRSNIVCLLGLVLVVWLAPCNRVFGQSSTKGRSIFDELNSVETLYKNKLKNLDKKIAALLILHEI